MGFILMVAGLWLAVVWLLHDDSHYDSKSGMSNLNIFTRFDNKD
jgi:hypothetical protein